MAQHHSFRLAVLELLNYLPDYGPFDDLNHIQMLLDALLCNLLEPVVLSVQEHVADFGLQMLARPHVVPH